MFEVTRSTEEAMVVLKKHHAELIQIAREVAREIALEKGTVHSREVRSVMVSRGLLTGEEGREHWFGAVFRGGEFEWTGKYHSYSDSSRNVHERSVKIWRLRQDRLKGI